jgi:hypothetical protein
MTAPIDLIPPPGKKPGWNCRAAYMGLLRHPVRTPWPSVEISFLRPPNYPRLIDMPRYRVDEYIKRGLLDPTQRDNL